MLIWFSFKSHLGCKVKQIELVVKIIEIVRLNP